MKTNLLIVISLMFVMSVQAQLVTVHPVTPEQSGDENAAAGKYAAAIDQYKTAWLGWFIGRNEANADLRSAHERLAGKMGATLAKMTTRPTIPEDADFHAQKGAAFVKLAKTPLDFLKAASQFQEAVNGAPWFFDYHFNLAVAYKSAGQFKDALYSLSLAKLLAANDKDRHDANALRAEIEAAQEMVAPAAQAEREKQQLAEKIKAFDGVVFFENWIALADKDIARRKAKIVGQELAVGYERFRDGNTVEPEVVFGERFSYEHNTEIFRLEGLDLTSTHQITCEVGGKNVPGVRKIKVDLDQGTVTISQCNETHILKR